MTLDKYCESVITVCKPTDVSGMTQLSKNKQFSSLYYIWELRIANNFVTARRTSAKFCTRTRVVRGLNMG